jgi:signal transduction histidine kinase
MFDAGRNPVPADQWPWMGALRGESTFSKECSLVRTSGRSFNVLFSAAPIRTLSRKIVGAAATLIDITECKRTELIIRSEALCKERGRMAEDIHDTLCQGLHAILLQLQAAEDQFPKNLDEVHRHFLRAQVVARENLTEAQRSLWTLSNEPPETGKFAEALSLIARQLFAASPVTVELHLQDEEPAISPKMQSDLLRIAKEGLVNVLKHAHATKVRIELTFSQRGLCLSVEDNGKGIVHVAAHGKPRSFGLTSIRKRAERLGGKVDIESQPGRGTRITLAAPIHSGSLIKISTR